MKMCLKSNSIDCTLYVIVFCVLTRNVTAIYLNENEVGCESDDDCNRVNANFTCKDSVCGHLNCFSCEKLNRYPPLENNGCARSNTDCGSCLSGYHQAENVENNKQQPAVVCFISTTMPPTTTIPDAASIPQYFNPVIFASLGLVGFIAFIVGTVVTLRYWIRKKYQQPKTLAIPIDIEEGDKHKNASCSRAQNHSKEDSHSCEHERTYKDEQEVELDDTFPSSTKRPSEIGKPDLEANVDAIQTQKGGAHAAETNRQNNELLAKEEHDESLRCKSKKGVARYRNADTRKITHKTPRRHCGSVPSVQEQATDSDVSDLREASQEKLRLLGSENNLKHDDAPKRLVDSAGSVPSVREAGRRTGNSNDQLNTSLQCISQEPMKMYESRTIGSMGGGRILKDSGVSIQSSGTSDTGLERA